MPFGYLRDPLFLVVFATYWINRGLEDLGYSHPLVRSYLNDFICVPFWIPILVWVLRVLRIRPNDAIPSAMEILIPMLIWAVTFEVALPLWAAGLVPAVADPFDVVSYFAGGLLALVFWQFYYRQGSNAAELDQRCLAASAEIQQM